MFQKILRFSIRNKLTVGILTVVLIVWGVWSLMQLPFDSTPDITTNQVSIITQAPSLGAEEVEQYVTTPIERAMANIPRVEGRRSTSRSGLSIVTLVFDDDADIYWARELVNQQLREAEDVLPKDQATVGLAPITTGLGEIYHYTLRTKPGYEDRYSLTELRELQDWVVHKQLSGTPGVAEVSGWGGYVRQYEVAIDADRLNALGITIPEFYRALADNNSNAGGSYIERYSNQYFIRGLGLVSSLDDIRKIPVAYANGHPVLVRDVAEVRFSHANRYGAVTRNGEGEVVAGIVLMLKGENFQEVSKRVKERLAKIQESLPEGVVIEPFIDRTDLVDRVTHTIGRNLIEGGLIVIFILVLFLGNWRAGLIVASMIPLAMLFAFGMMHQTGVSGNLMSLGAIDFGLIVDGAVIIVEAVVAHITTKYAASGKMLTQKEMDHEVFAASSRIRQSAAFGEIIIMMVYLPLLSLVGIEGKMFRPMALTIFYAILGAFILSLTYVPAASALFLSKRTEHRESFSDRLINALQRLYDPVIHFSLRWSKTLIAAMVALFGASLLMFRTMGGEFIPTLEEGDLAAQVSMAQGTSLGQMTRTMSDAERILMKFPEVKQVVTRIGSAEIPTDPMPVERADMLIALHPKSTWTTASTTEGLQQAMSKALKLLPGVDVEMTQPIQMRNNELITGIKQDVAIKIYGPDLDVLSEQAKHLADLIRHIPGISEPFAEKVNGLPQIQVRYNRDRLAQYGVDIATANDVLETAFVGKEAGYVFENDRRFDLVLRLDGAKRNDIETLEGLFLPTAGGTTVPLTQVAEVTFASAPSQITHEEGSRRIYVGFNIEGRDVQSAVEEIEEVIREKAHLPAGYYYTFGGEFQNLQEATQRLMVAVPIALALILILLFATLKSLRETLFVFSAIPLSAIGGIMALWSRGMPFSISAGVGFIALFGVAVLNGIVLIGQFNQLEREGMTDVQQRILTGCRHRLRPVLMTALVASIGFLPMAISNGDGAEVQRPLATVVIGGLVTATILTLIIMPAIYKTFTPPFAQRKMRPTKGTQQAADSSIYIYNEDDMHSEEGTPATPKGNASPSALILLAALLCLPATALAQQAAEPQRMTLEECLDVAAAQNPDQRIAELMVEKARRLEATAYDMANTSIALRQEPTGGGGPENGINFSQEFDFPTLYAKRHQLMKAQTALETSRHELSLAELQRDVALAYYELARTLDRQQLLLRQDTLYAEFLQKAESKVRHGEASRLDALNARTLRRDNRLQMEQAEANALEAMLRLQLLLGTTQPVLPIVAKGMPERPATGAEMRMDEHPMLDVCLSTMEVGRRELNVARHEFLPNFSVGVTAQAVIHGFNPYHVDRSKFQPGNFMGFEVGIGIPLFYGAKRARLRAAKTALAIAEAEQQRAQRTLQAERTTARAKTEEAWKRLKAYNDEYLPEARETERMSRGAYAAGDIGMAELTLHLTTVCDTELRYNDAFYDYLCALARESFLFAEP